MKSESADHGRQMNRQTSLTLYKWNAQQWVKSRDQEDVRVGAGGETIIGRNMCVVHQCADTD